MLGWLFIIVGLGLWAKESYDRNHVKYSSPEAERYFTQANNDIGKQRLYDDLKAGVPLEERNRRRMEGYYDRKVR